MIKYYGIGTWWKSIPYHQQFYNYVNNSRVCIHASLDKPTNREITNRQRFRDIFHRIEKGDVVYLKSYKIRGHMVRIRAVGKVISKDCSREAKDLFCVNVHYHKYDFNGLVDDFNDIDDGVPRDERVYQESNPDIIRKINRLLQE